MKALYIGILSDGTTSRLRADALQRVTGGWMWSLLDTDRPFRAKSRISRTLAFRGRIGSAVRAMNRVVADHLAEGSFDVIWVDKGVYLWPSAVAKLRDRAKHLIHYTPDTAFLNNRSRFFNATANLYDLLVTTKSFEVKHYERLVPKNRLMMTTQSFDSQLHRPRCAFAKKKSEAVFVGLCEPDREACIDRVLRAEIPVRIGGQGWRRFVRRHSGNPLLTFEGDWVRGDHYAELLSQASVGLGLLTKRFPELHTTRTFEIPACGTLLATERNEETLRLFNEDEVLFFSDYADLAERMKQAWESPQWLATAAAKGRQKVQSGGYDNDTIVRRVLDRLSLV